jgi:hypothetical protein
VAAVSYSVVVGGTLEQVVAATSAPGAGQIELRIDQTATTVTDSQSTTGTRAPKKGEVLEAVVKLLQYLIRDTNVIE